MPTRVEQLVKVVRDMRADGDGEPDRGNHYPHGRNSGDRTPPSGGSDSRGREPDPSSSWHHPDASAPPPEPFGGYGGADAHVQPPAATPWASQMAAGIGKHVTSARHTGAGKPAPGLAGVAAPRKAAWLHV